MSEAEISSRTGALRALVKAFLVLLLSVGIARGVVLALGCRAELGRVQAVLEVLPSIAQEARPTVIFLGTSSLMRLQPEVFDNELSIAGKRVRSFNLSLNDLGPPSLYLMSRWFRDVFEAAPKKPSLVVLEFSPLVCTRIFAKRSLDFVDNQVVILHTMETLREAFFPDPAHTFMLGFRHYLFGGILPSETQLVVSQRLYRESGCGVGVPPYYLPQTHEALKAYCAAVASILPQGHPVWDAVTRGSFDRVYPETLESYRRFVASKQVDPVMEGNMKKLEREYGVRDLDFDPQQLAKFINSAKILKASSGRLAIVVSPVDPKWYKRSPEGNLHLESAIRDIEREVGVKVFNYSLNPTFVHEDFADPDHLHQLGSAQKFSRLVAHDVAEYL